MADHSDTIWDRWEEVDDLLAAAMELDPTDRERLLEARAEGDPELVHVVRSLLVSVDTAKGHLDRVPRAVWRTLHRRRGIPE